MFEAQILMANAEVFSPWFPRQGDSAIFTLEIVQAGGAASIQVKVFTKNTEDTGDGSDADAGFDIGQSTPNRYSEELLSTDSTGLEELVRYKFKVEGDAGEFIMFRMLPPVWFDSVKV